MLSTTTELKAGGTMRSISCEKLPAEIRVRITCTTSTLLDPLLEFFPSSVDEILQVRQLYDLSLQGRQVELLDCRSLLQAH